MMHTVDALGKDQKVIAAFATLLCKLGIAGFEKRSITAAASMFGVQKPGKYVFRLAIVSLSLDYLVMVPYHRSDKMLLV